MATFLKNLFAPKWQHADANVRLQALDQVNDAQIIESLAKQDPAENVRLKAISLISNLESLPSFFNDKSANIKQAAITQYLARLLKSDQLADQLQAISNIEDAQQLMTVATITHAPELTQAAINQIKDETRLFDFIMQSASAKSRLLAVQYITSKDKLKEIEQGFLNKDKTLVRHVKEKLSALASQAALEEKQQAKIQQLLNNAQQLTQQAFSPTYAGQIALLKQSWQDSQTQADQQTTFNQAIAKCEQVLADHQQQQADIDQAQAAHKQAQALQLDSIDQLKTLYAQCKSSTPTLDALTQALDGANQTWQSAQALTSNIDKQVKNEYETLIKPIVNLQASLAFLASSSIDLAPIKQALQSQSLIELKQQLKNIDGIFKAVNWPNEFPSSSELNSISTLKNELESALSSLQQDEKQVLNSIRRSLDEYEKSITQGHVKNAKRLQNSIRKNVEQVDAHKTKTLQSQFQLLSQSFNELKDWQGFATRPKFEQLCTDMAALVDTDMDPKDKADAIRALQDQWKSLGSLPDQKQQQALWLQFKQFADAAYEPCQAYFAEMAKVRIYNLEQRTVICDQLEQFFTHNDWDNANWKSVQQILDKAHDEFKAFSPVNHTEKKAIMQRFHDATHNIHNKLVEHFKYNAAEKQALIDEVTALHNADDIAQAIEQCKAIQNQWKEKGNAGRAERQLWNDFRQQCDALFEMRNAASQARKQYFDDNIAKANALSDQAKHLLENITKDTQSQLQAISQEINELELPAKVKQAISKNLAEQQTQLNQAIKQQKRQAQYALWVNAQQLAQNFGQAEQQGKVDSDALMQDIASTDLPAQVKTILQDRLNNQAHTNTDTLEKLCLELEIVLEVESPEADQAARMALQVERLQKNMGQNLPNLDEQLESLQCRWFAVSGHNADYSSLHARFFGTLNKQVESAE